MTVLLSVTSLRWGDQKSALPHMNWMSTRRNQPLHGKLRVPANYTHDPRLASHKGEGCREAAQLSWLAQDGTF